MKNQYPLPDEYLVEIGRLVALSAHLEQAINICIGKLAGYNDEQDATPFILTNHSSVPQKIDMIGAICEEKKSAYRHLCSHKEVTGKLREAFQLRNKYVHGGMNYDDKLKCCTIALASARGKLKVEIKRVDISEINKASKTVHEAMVKLMGFVVNKEYEVPDLF